MTEQQNKNRIDFLDFMRVFAFISVLVGHKLFKPIEAFASDTTNHLTLRYAADLVAALCNGGGAGVIVFFLTSGYIITHVLKADAPIDFLIKRLFRIYPLYIFAVLLQLFLNWMFRDAPIPNASVLIPQLLLIGDFFGTPYALDGVEWTLRVEVIFYVFMVALKGIGLFSRPSLLPLLFCLTATAMSMANPFPSGYEWSDGYTFIFGPYLFIGSILYLVERGTTGKTTGILAIGFLFAISLYMLGAIQPRWNAVHFPALGLLVFSIAWIFRESFHAGPIIRPLSDLTFSVYLLHTWLWNYINQALKAFHVNVLPEPLQIIPVLFFLCYLAYRYIERPAIQLGRTLLQMRHKKTDKQILGPQLQ